MEKLTAANTTLNTAIEARDRDLRTEINELNTKEKQLLDRLKLLDEKKLKVALSNGDVDVTDEDLVEINAGGKVIAVSRSTLTQFKGTKLEALFSGTFDSDRPANSEEREMKQRMALFRCNACARTFANAGALRLFVICTTEVDSLGVKTLSPFLICLLNH